MNMLGSCPVVLSWVLAGKLLYRSYELSILTIINSHLSLPLSGPFFPPSLLHIKEYILGSYLLWAVVGLESSSSFRSWTFTVAVGLWSTPLTHSVNWMKLWSSTRGNHWSAHRFKNWKRWWQRKSSLANGAGSGPIPLKPKNSCIRAKPTWSILELVGQVNQA